LPVFAVEPADPAAEAVQVTPGVTTPGGAIKLRWLFTGDKVVVSGGRFGKGVEVTGKSELTDTVKISTTYKFDVWYKVPTAGPSGEITQKPVHVQYTAFAKVAKPTPIVLKTYRDPYGWQVAHMADWKSDREKLPDPANNALVFIQKEDDSVERLAVSILPLPDLDKTQLVEKVEKSLFSNYGDIKMGERMEIQQNGAPAILTSFSGQDQSHPGTRTQTLLLAFVRNGRGYVISARTTAKEFEFRRPALEKMVRSFAVLDKTASK
jgi:hypothetical protein